MTESESTTPADANPPSPVPAVAPPAPAATPLETPAANAADTMTDEQLHERIVDACKNVHDPEIPVNIYELGLIYEILIAPNRDVTVKMTLTSPSCPAAQELPLEVRGRVAVIPGVNDVEVDVVFDPPWTPAKMSEAAKVQLGFDL